MTKPEKGRAPEPDGERFLEDLDAALTGQEPSSEHAESARVAGQLAGVLQSQDGAAPESLRQKIESKPLDAGRKASTVVRMDRALRRFRLGVLDVAALVALSILGVLIWRGVQEETTAEQEPKKPKTETRLAAEDSKATTPKPVDPNAPPVQKPLDAENWREQINERVPKKISSEFVEAPIEDALGYFQKTSGVTMIVAPKALADGWDQKQVTLECKDISVASALRWVLRFTGLEYSLRDQVVFITRHIVDPLELRVYDVRNVPVSAELLADLLRSS